MIKLKIIKNCVEFTLNGTYYFKRVEDLPKFWEKENVPFEERSYVLEEQIVTWEIWNNATNPPIVEKEIKVRKVEAGISNNNSQEVRHEALKKSNATIKVKNIRTIGASKNNNQPLDSFGQTNKSTTEEAFNDFKYAWSVWADKGKITTQSILNKQDEQRYLAVSSSEKLVQKLTSKIEIDLLSGASHKKHIIEEKVKSFSACFPLGFFKLICTVVEVSSDFAVIYSQYGYGVIEFVDWRVGSKFDLIKIKDKTLIYPIFDSIKYDGNFYIGELDELFYKINKRGFWENEQGNEFADMCLNYRGGYSERQSKIMMNLLNAELDNCSTVSLDGLEVCFKGEHFNLTIVKVGTERGIVDKNNNFVIKPIFRYIEKSKYGFIAYFINKRYGVERYQINEQGIVSPF